MPCDDIIAQIKTRVANRLGMGGGRGIVPTIVESNFIRESYRTAYVGTRAYNYTKEEGMQLVQTAKYKMVTINRMPPFFSFP